MSEQVFCVPHSWTLADTPALREEVYTFRYKHYFKNFPDAPWIDRKLRRVYLPHDDHSTHLMARNGEGQTIAVGTGTPADSADLPEEWVKLLRLNTLTPLNLSRVLIFSRLAELPQCRGSLLFLEFFKHAARVFIPQGFGYIIHYSPPELVPMYERLGYRAYAEGGTLGSGLCRIPMMLVAADAAYLSRVHPAFLEATQGLVPAGDAELAYRLLPKLSVMPQCIDENEK